VTPTGQIFDILISFEQFVPTPSAIAVLACRNTNLSSGANLLKDESLKVESLQDE